MKILFDTNVVLDLMLLRDPYFKTAALRMAEAEDNNNKIAVPLSCI
jgi:predicted nucleic acid-binding protein